MLIDFHTHFFPDKIAKDSCDKLANKAKVTYHGDGALNGLLSFMKEDGVDVSVNQPVATKPEQVQAINRKMAEINRAGKSVVNFGAMHPEFEGIEEEVEFLRLSGIKGIKLHPEYQEFCPEEKRMARLYEACAANNIAILFHSGVDLGYDTVHCLPKGAADLLKIKGLTVIFAHMGAYRLWNDVEKLLVGKNCYFDTAYCNEMDNTQLKRMILNHGSDKILFGSDFPWERASVMKKKLDALGLAQSDLDNIYFKNASKLLGTNWQT
jgi:uncharacterized protein